MRSFFIALTMLVLSFGYAEAKSHHHYKHHATHHRHSTTSLAGFPAPLVTKILEIESACGSHVNSAYRPGAHVAGTGHISNHALKKAVDVAGNPRCIYAHLKGWPGGYSTDYGAVHHVHISYNPHGAEWGCRFAHYGNHYVRYARIHHHHHYASGA